MTLFSEKLGKRNHLVVFGGSFDPPHIAHSQLPQMVCKKLGADAVVYVPAGRAPHKLDRVQSEAHHRLKMLQLAIADLEDTLILTEELDRAVDGLPTFTIDTLMFLIDQLPHAKLRLLIGADQLKIFESWKSPDRIIEIADPVVMVRPPETRKSLARSLDDELYQHHWAKRLVQVPEMQVSSSQIRHRVRRGHMITDLVASNVAHYIEQQGLYKT